VVNRSAKQTQVTSPLSGFHRLSVLARRARLVDLGYATSDELETFEPERGLTVVAADAMVENAVGVFSLPLGVCAHLCVNGRDRVVPMVVEEPSVIAAASHAAKLLREGGGIDATASDPIVSGQVQLLDVPDFEAAEHAIHAARDALLVEANGAHRRLIAAGGGARDVELRRLEPLGPDDPVGPMLVVHLHVDVREAMGANIVNTMCERLAPRLEALSGGRARLRILSNLCDRRTVTVRGGVPVAALGGEDLAQGVVEASVFAERDPYRAATHNKGIMNGVDAVMLATGQDWRAVEAGAHAFAARSGRYTALARWRVAGGLLRGEMTLPLAVGVVGGVVRVHPSVRSALRVADVEGARDLAQLAAAVGLAQNLGALRALAGEGIQSGHMRLHARNVSVEAGARGPEVEVVSQIIADDGLVNLDRAREVLEELRGRESAS
jgi:hydroxymethylglutaryl-CoA reductase